MSNVIKFRRRNKAPRSPVLLARLAIISIAGGLASLSISDGAKARDDVSRSFTLCHTGGGTNCVVDGDTIWLDGQKIRVADIDAPETHPPRCPAEAALGERATHRLHQLVNAGPFTVATLDRDTDGYGRKLRGLTRDGQSLGDVLVSEGLARTWSGRREPWC
ncbi:thermonuclease family protein [Sphingobium indicum]|uniref:thermonuclease family protein n=1 Tax=Sphingobium TaxID=165695 RepID=UPI000423D909|nr:thermonuclease family protein [Sphingobium sp. PNB]MCB4863019.1 thermonuclease family protein [Sphingobium sp. PNB]